MKMWFLHITAIFLIMSFSDSCNSQTVRLFTGSFTESGEKGFNIFDLNRKEGTFNLVSESDAGPNPSYFCISKKHGYIYAANEVMTFKGIKGGCITTMSYNPKTGGVEKINELVVPNGGPCFISLSPGEDFLFIANYPEGSIAVVRLDEKGIPLNVTDYIAYLGEEGTVSHAHMISSDPSGKRVYVTDLGLDRIVIYNLDAATGKLHQIQNGIATLSKGAGPRHFVFSSDGTKMYVICESNSTISVFNVNSKGELKQIQNLSTLAEGFTRRSSCADIHIGKNGKYLYGSNRGENTIVTFRVSTDGTLVNAGRTPCGGETPRNFVIDPSGEYLLVGNQKSGNISFFKLDNKTGLPIEPAKQINLIAPACLKFLN